MSVNATDSDLLRFTAAKEAHTRALSRSLTNKLPSIVWSFFDAVRVDDWMTATNLAERLHQASGRFGPPRTEPYSPALRTLAWTPISETVGACESFHDWDNKWLHRFGREIIDSIPRGSIYFGGTDAGRFIVSALAESQIEGRPFFTLTQNQLADLTYLDYLQKIYGSRIHIPDTNEVQRAFVQYTTDARERLRTGRLKPGENVWVTPEGRVQVSGQVAVMELNALLARVVVEKSPGREVFIEESFPIDWMYPYLSPHGLILQLHPEPLTELRPAEVQKDQAYWKRLAGELIGDWVGAATSTRELTDFADKIYLRKDLAGFKGDAAFAGNEAARRSFCKLRTAIATLYLWRADHARDDDERNRMRQAAELAFRQAIALCPSSPEAVFRYGKFLNNLKRHEEALRITETALRLDPDNDALQNFLRSLRKTE